MVVLRAVASMEVQIAAVMAVAMARVAARTVAAQVGAS